MKLKKRAENMFTLECTWETENVLNIWTNKHIKLKQSACVSILYKNLHFNQRFSGSIRNVWFIWYYILQVYDNIWYSMHVNFSNIESIIS